jgi:hypothetical protein
MGKYNSYTAEFKVKVMKFAEQNGNRAAERKFSVNEAHIRYWRKQKEALCKAKCCVRAFRGPKTGKFPTLEEKLLKYFQETRSNGNAVSHKMLQFRARDIAQSLNISENEFKASRGWIDRFMKRKNLSVRTPLCQKLPSDFTL